MLPGPIDLFYAFAVICAGDAGSCLVDGAGVGLQELDFIISEPPPFSQQNSECFDILCLALLTKHSPIFLSCHFRAG